MDFIKSSFGLHKHKQSQILNPTSILMAQIANHFIADLKLGDNEEEEMIEKENKTNKDIDTNNDKEDKCRHKIKHKQLLSELLETERKYVHDLEEVSVVLTKVCYNLIIQVCSAYLPLSVDPYKRSSLVLDRPRLATCGARRPYSCPTINQSCNQNTGEYADNVEAKK